MSPRAARLLLAIATPAATAIAAPADMQIFGSPRVEPLPVQPGQSATYVVSTVDCGWIGTPSVQRAGNRIEVAIPYAVLCGLPIQGEDLRIDLGPLPPGPYAVRLLPCEGYDAETCIAQPPLPYVEFRVAGPAAAPVAAPALDVAGKTAVAMGLLLLGVLARTRGLRTRRSLR